MDKMAVEHICGRCKKGKGFYVYINSCNTWCPTCNGGVNK